MNSTYFCLIALCLLAGCGESLPKEKYGNTLYFGKIKVIDTDGGDMTGDCTFHTILPDNPPNNSKDNKSIVQQLRKDGFAISQAKFGINPLFPLRCKTLLYGSRSHDTVRDITIPGVLMLPITDEISANYFGDVAITLHYDGSLDVTHSGYTHKDLYKGPLPVVELEPLPPAEKLTWQKTVGQVMSIYSR